MTDPAQPPSPAFAALGRWAIRARWGVIAITAAVALASLWVTLSMATIDTSIEKFAADDSSAREVLDAYRDEFGRDEMFLLVAEGDVFTRPFIERLEALHIEAATLDMPLASLGQRGRHAGMLRHAVLGIDSPIAALFDDGGILAAPNGGAAPSAPEPIETPKTEPKAAPADDGFGFEGGGDDGFGDSGGDGFDFEGGDDAGWGDEAGGTIIEQAVSLINVRRTRGGAGGVQVGELMQPLPTAQALLTLKAEVLADPSLVGQVVDPAGRHAVIALRTQFMSEGDSARVYEVLLEIAERHRADGFALHVSGVPSLNAGLNEMLITDLGRLAGLSAVAMFFIMGFLFRHPLAVMGPMLVVGLSAVVTAAGMSLIGVPLTMLSNILPAFLFCVGIGHSVHIISVYRDGMRYGLDPDAALVASLGSTGRPVLYTSLTTMVGLASFVFASLDVIGEMGLSGAFGVFVAFVLSITFLPAVLSFNRSGHPMGAATLGERDNIDRFLDGCRNLSGLPGDDGMGPEPAIGRTKRRRTLVALVVLVIIGGFGVSTMRMWHNPLSWLPDDTPMKIGFGLLDDHIGGSGNVQLLIDGPEDGGLKNLELLKGLDALRAHITSFQHPEFGTIVGNSIGITDVIKETNQAINGGDPAFYRLPDTDGQVANLFVLFENAGPDELRRIATIDLQRGQETIRVKWLEATRYQPLVDHIDVGIEKHIPEHSTVQATGSIYTLVSTVGNLLWDLLSSFGAALIVITIIMMILLGGWRLGLIAMVPNLMPIIMIGGIMGFGEIPIDMNNLLIGSISIGVAVDDTIHLLHQWRISMKRTGGNVEEALRYAMRHSGRAMVSTSMILLIGFSVYLGATMYNIQRFGFLVGLTALMALLIDLIFAPALLRTFYARPARTQETSDAQTA